MPLDALGSIPIKEARANAELFSRLSPEVAAKVYAAPTNIINRSVLETDHIDGSTVVSVTSDALTVQEAQEVLEALNLLDGKTT